MDEFKLEVQNMYDEHLRNTEKRGISWGEIAHIENLNKKELKGLYNELLEKNNI